MQHGITWRNTLTYLCLPKWCCIAACKHTKDKHIFRDCALKLLSPEAFFSPKCTKSFGGRAPPGSPGGVYTAPADPRAGFKEPTSTRRVRGGKGGEGMGREGRKGRKGGNMRHWPYGDGRPWLWSLKHRACVCQCVRCICWRRFQRRWTLSCYTGQWWRTATESATTLTLITWLSAWRRSDLGRAPTRRRSPTPSSTACDRCDTSVLASQSVAVSDGHTRHPMVTETCGPRHFGTLAWSMETNSLVVSGRRAHKWQHTGEASMNQSINQSISLMDKIHRTRRAIMPLTLAH